MTSHLEPSLGARTPTISAATMSLPGSLWINASTADASRTVIAWRQHVGARRAAPRRTSVTSARHWPARVTRRRRPVDAPTRAAAQPGAGAVDHREPIPAPRGPSLGSPDDLADQNQCGIHESSVPRTVQSWQMLGGRTASRTCLGTRDPFRRSLADTRRSRHASSERTHLGH